MITSDTPTTAKDTAETIGLFNDAFQRRDKDALAALVHEDCVMVSAQPAPRRHRVRWERGVRGVLGRAHGRRVDHVRSPARVHRWRLGGGAVAIPLRAHRRRIRSRRECDAGQRRSRPRATWVHQDARWAPASRVTPSNIEGRRSLRREMIIIAGYELVRARDRNTYVDAFCDLVSRP